MSSKQPLSSVAQIFELLKLEKDALIEGDIDALENVTALKQAWIEDLSDRPLPLDLDQIRKIKRMSDQNSLLSASCQSAQKAVLNRLSEIQKIQKTMGIYSVGGTFSETTDPVPNVESRS